MEKKWILNKIWVFLRLKNWFSNSLITNNVFLAAVSQLLICISARFPQAELYDIISKNLEKVTNPKGEEKPSMYWGSRGTGKATGMNLNNLQLHWSPAKLNINQVSGSLFDKHLK